MSKTMHTIITHAKDKSLLFPILLHNTQLVWRLNSGFYLEKREIRPTDEFYQGGVRRNTRIIKMG